MYSKQYGHGHKNNRTSTQHLKNYLCVRACVFLCATTVILAFYVGDCFSSLEIIYEGSFYI